MSTECLRPLFLAQQPQICRWYHSNGRKWRGTEGLLNEGIREEWKSWFETQHSKNCNHGIWSHQFSRSVVSDLVTPWTAARKASLSITNSRSSHKLISIESVMPSNHLILCRPFLFPPSIFPSIRVFSKESALRIRWPKYWSFSFSISGLLLLSKGLDI